jgi:capsular exopolysaccharide synthesis family protein
MQSMQSATTSTGRSVIPSEPPLRPAIEPRDVALWGTLHRRRWLILGTTLVVMAGSAYATHRLAPVYEATASIRIDERLSTLPMDPSQLSTRSELNTDIEELSSRVLAQAVAESLGVQLALVRPADVPRNELFTNIHVTPTAEDSAAAASGARAPSQNPGLFASVMDRFSPSTENQYRLVRRRNGGFDLTHPGAKTPTVIIPSRGTVKIGSVSFSLTPKADSLESIEFAVIPFVDAVENLRSAREVVRPGAGREVNIVLLRYRGQDPVLASQIVNTLASTYIVRRQEAQRADLHSTVAFLREQIAKLSERLAQQENSLRSFREREQVVSLPDEARNQVDRLSQVQVERNKLETERVALAELVKSVDSDASRMQLDGPSPYRRLLASPELIKSDIATQLLTSLTQAEDKLADLRTHRTAQDPDVQAARQRIRDIQEQLRGIAVSYLQTVTSQLSTLDSTRAEYSRHADRLPAREIELDRMQREPKVLEQMYALLQTRLQEAQVAEAMTYPGVRLVDPAVPSTSPVAPRPALNLALALVAGLMLGVSGALALDHFDRAIHTRRQVQLATGGPVLGIIPHARRESRLSTRLRGAAKHVRRLKPAQGDVEGHKAGRDKSGASATPVSEVLRPVRNLSHMSESYGRLAINLAFAQGEGSRQVLLVTSPLPGDGKTTVASNLALTLALRGTKVLLVDADLRRGRVHSLFDAPRRPGLSDVLSGSKPLSSVIRRVRVSANTELSFIATGQLHPNPPQLFGVDAVRELLEPLRAEYDTIIFDTAPLNVVSDAAMLSTHVDGVIVVARAGVTEPGALSFAMEQLDHVQSRVIGTVLNDVELERDAYYDGTYAYYVHDPEEYVSSKEEESSNDWSRASRSGRRERAGDGLAGEHPAVNRTDG